MLVLKTYTPHANHTVLPSAIVLKYGRKPFDDDEADAHGEVSVEKSGGSPPDFLFLLFREYQQCPMSWMVANMPFSGESVSVP
jgi:hypothetical protein